VTTGILAGAITTTITTASTTDDGALGGWDEFLIVVVGSIVATAIVGGALYLWRQRFRVTRTVSAEFWKSEGPVHIIYLRLHGLPPMTHTVTALVRPSRRGRDAVIGPDLAGPNGEASIAFGPTTPPLDWSKDKLRVRVIVRLQDDSRRTVFQRWVRTPTD
jgi:hypothetical protein